MYRHRFCTIPLALALAYLAPCGVSAQGTGYVHLRTHFPGQSADDNELGVTRLFVQGANGLEETFSQEFAPGPHTFARVETTPWSCRATADNVSFTIKAGQWTNVDVPVTLRDCTVAMSTPGLGGRGSGVGSFVAGVVANEGGAAVAGCGTLVDQQGQIVWTNFHGCQGTAAYGAHVLVTSSPGVNSFGSDPYTFVADTNLATSAATSVTFEATNDNDSPAATNLSTDLGISLVGGTYGGQVMTSTFRIVNHGPDNAWSVAVNVDNYIVDEDKGDAGVIASMTDGVCLNGGRCTLAWLPAGDSTTLTVRVIGVPLDFTDTSAANFPTLTPYCTTVTVSNVKAAYTPTSVPNDPNLSNNTAGCFHSVPVTVAVGGATPAGHTVQKGSTDVPMLEFLLTPALQQTVNSVTVHGSGTGDEHLDITAVKLYVDKNGNGQVDAGDSVLASGTFSKNDGTAVLTVDPGFAISKPTNLLVTYSFSLTLAERVSRSIALAALPLFLVPVMRRRRRWIGVFVVILTGVGLASCSSDAISPKKSAGSVTFQTTLTGVTVSGTSVPNVSVAGATITVDK